MKNDTYETAINFGGFYETTHDKQVDLMVAHDLGEDCFIDVECDDEIDYDSKVWQEFNDFEKYRVAYCKGWLDLFNDKFNTKLSFVEIDSPRFYNFTTDKIIANVSNDDVKVLIDYIKESDLKEVLFEAIKENTTSSDGYVAFYTYHQYFLKENRHFLIETIIDTVLENEFYDMPLFVEDIFECGVV